MDNGRERITEVPASRGIHVWGNVKENTSSCFAIHPSKRGELIIMEVLSK